MDNVQALGKGTYGDYMCQVCKREGVCIAQWTQQTIIMLQFSLQEKN